MGVNLALATWLYFHFGPGHPRLDGNDGYQSSSGDLDSSLNVEYSSFRRISSRWSF